VFLFIGERYKYVRILAFLIPIVLIGLRDNVGTDYLSYNYIFENIDTNIWIEPGYWILNKLINYAGYDFYVLNTLISIITFSFIFLRINDFKEKHLFFWFSLIFILSQSGYSFMVNGVRQSLAIAVFFYATRYIESRQLKRYLLFIIIGASFHFSILFLVPIYFFSRLRLNFYLYLSIFSLSLIIMSLGIMDSLYSIILNNLGYEKSTDLGSASMDSSIGFLFMTLIGFIILSVSKKYISNNKDLLLFNCFFLSYIIRFIFLGNMSLFRLYLYFDIIGIIYILNLIDYKFNISHNRLILKGTLFIIYLIFFIKGVTNPNYLLSYKFIDI